MTKYGTQVVVLHKKGLVNCWHIKKIFFLLLELDNMMGFVMFNYQQWGRNLQKTNTVIIV